MTARGPDRAEWNAAKDVQIAWEYDRDDIAYDDVPFSFTETNSGYADSGDYTYDCSTSYQIRNTSISDLQREYTALAGIVNSVRAELAELKRIVETWTADS